MQGDFSRNSFDPRNQFLRVLHQQGRVQLDADVNEQTSILLHYLQTLAHDLIGDAAGPKHNCGFEITHGALAKKPSKKSPAPKEDFWISRGRYYVDGLLCENPENVLLTHKLSTFPQLVYLDVWEQYVSADDQVDIAEPALEGVATTARSKVSWLVRCTSWEGDKFDRDKWETKLDEWQPDDRGQLLVKPVATTAMDVGDVEDDVDAAAAYTGENQLYRVEIHQGGAAGNEATFKWARDNGSNTYPIVSISGPTVTISSAGRDELRGLKQGSVVELIEPQSPGDSDPAANPKPLFTVKTPPNADGILVLSGVPANVPASGSYLRRWDHVSVDGNSAIPLVEGQWIELEHGLAVMFQASKGSTYRRLDYWMIAARPGIGAAIWRHSKQDAIPAPPDGIEHHYAPLAIIGAGNVLEPLTREFAAIGHVGP